MTKEMLINVLQPEECRIAIVEDGAPPAGRESAEEEGEARERPEREERGRGRGRGGRSRRRGPERAPAEAGARETPAPGEFPAEEGQPFAEPPPPAEEAPRRAAD